MLQNIEKDQEINGENEENIEAKDSKEGGKRKLLKRKLIIYKFLM